jgi:hypothetical protein
MRVDEFIVCRAGRNYDGGFLRACRLSIARIADFATQNRTHRCSLGALILGGCLCEDVVHLVSLSLSLKVQTSRASCCPSSWEDSTCLIRQLCLTTKKLSIALEVHSARPSKERPGAKPKLPNPAGLLLVYWRPSIAEEFYAGLRQANRTGAL